MRYRYGFNGKEKDKDLGEGMQDYGMRVYDCKLAKFLSNDPLTKSYPELTPYQFASNSPIQNIDIDGMEGGRYKSPQNQSVLLPTHAADIQYFRTSGYVGLVGHPEAMVYTATDQVYSFISADQTYTARFWPKTKLFAGYYSQSTNQKYESSSQNGTCLVFALDVLIQGAYAMQKMNSEYIPLSPPKSNNVSELLNWNLGQSFNSGGSSDCTPDAFTVSSSASVSSLLQITGTLTSTVILKGPDASISPYFSAGFDFGLVTSAEAEVSGAYGNVYSLNGKPYTRDCIEGKSISVSVGIEIKLPYVIAGGGFGAGIGLDLDVDDWTAEKMKNPTSATVKGFISAGIGANTPVAVPSATSLLCWTWRL